MPNDIKVSGVRMVYPHVFKPWAGPNGDQKPQYQILLGLTQAAAAQMWQHEETILAQKVPDRAQWGQYKRWIQPVQGSGKEAIFASDPTITHYVSAKSDTPVRVYGPDANLIETEHDPRVYGGAKIVFHGAPFVYSKVGKGVSWRLYNVQILSHDPAKDPPMGNANPDPGFTAHANAGASGLPQPTMPTPPAAQPQGFDVSSLLK